MDSTFSNYLWVWIDTKPDVVMDILFYYYIWEDRHGVSIPRLDIVTIWWMRVIWKNVCFCQIEILYCVLWTRCLYQFKSISTICNEISRNHIHLQSKWLHLYAISLLGLTLWTSITLFLDKIGSREASRSVLHRSQEVGAASQEVSLMLE